MNLEVLAQYKAWADEKVRDNKAVVNHASYHRGHIEGVLYQMSVEPPTTDLPVFLRVIQ